MGSEGIIIIMPLSANLFISIGGEVRRSIIPCAAVIVMPRIFPRLNSF